MTWDDDERFFSRRMSEHEANWRKGNASALTLAVELCGAHSQPLPKWLRDAVCGFIEAKRPRMKKQDRIHYTRWDAVMEARERKEELKATWDAIAEQAVSKK